MIYEGTLTMLSGLEIWDQRSRHWILSNLRVIWSKAKHSQALEGQEEKITTVELRRSTSVRLNYRVLKTGNQHQQIRQL